MASPRDEGPLNGLTGSPWWVRVGTVYGPTAVIAVGLTWFLTFSVRQDYAMLRAQVELLTSAVQGYRESMRSSDEALRTILRNQEALARIERTIQAQCVNAASNMEQRERCLLRP